MGSWSGVEPDLLKMVVSIMPGWTLATNIFGFSTDKNSKVLIIAVFEAIYAERPLVICGGKARAPVVTPNTAACLVLAVGKKD